MEYADWLGLIRMNWKWRKSWCYYLTKGILILDLQKHQMSILDTISVTFSGVFIGGLDSEWIGSILPTSLRLNLLFSKGQEMGGGGLKWNPVGQYLLNNNSGSLLDPEDINREGTVVALEVIVSNRRHVNIWIQDNVRLTMTSSCTGYHGKKGMQPVWKQGVGYGRNLGKVFWRS